MTQQSQQYLDKKDADRIRIFFEGDNWAIDAANDDNYTQEIWTNHSGVPLTEEMAIRYAPDFARAIGKPELANEVYVESGCGQWHRIIYPNQTKSRQVS